MRIGIDLGGTKIEGIVLAPGGAVAARRRVPTPKNDYAATVAAVRDLVAALEGETDAMATVGIGMPGAISPRTGLVKNANSTWLNGKPFDKDMAAALGRPVRIENDANCFALSEAADGAGAGASAVFGVILGTGVGGGLIVGGRPHTGANAIGGEWGHNPLPWPRDKERPGAACYCGKNGCVETWLSGPGFARWASAEFGLSGTAEEIAAGPRAGSALAAYAERLGRALAVVVNIFDPDAIVLGGGLSNMDRLYTDVPAALQRWTFSDGVSIPVLKAKHGDSSGVRGAAWLWPEA
jgi:fructokinase